MIIFDCSAIIAGNPRFQSPIKVRGCKTTSLDGPRRWEKKKFTIFFQRAAFQRAKRPIFQLFALSMIIFDRSAIIAGNPRFQSPIKDWGCKTTSSDGPRRWAEKKLNFFSSKGRILVRKTAHFSTFRTVYDHFLITQRSSLKILIFSPRSKYGGAKRPARTGREDGRRK